MNSTDWTPEGWQKIHNAVEQSDYEYRPEFLGWLFVNPHVWRAFAEKAVQARKYENRGRFGAKAIIEFLRWDTVVAEKDITFKINNNNAPDLARLVMDVIPSMRGYFQIRGSEYRDDAAR